MDGLHYNFREFNGLMGEASLKVTESDLEEAIKLASGVRIDFFCSFVQLFEPSSHKEKICR